MGLISFIKNLFKQKEDDLWVDPNTNSKSSIADTKCDDIIDEYNDIIEINTLLGEIIIKGKRKETYQHEYWILENE